MKLMRVVLLFAAIVSLVVHPSLISMAEAATGTPSTADRILGLARQNQVALLTERQMLRLMKNDPALYAKLDWANKTHTVPALSVVEKVKVEALTQYNLRHIRAGQAATPAPTAPAGNPTQMGVVHPAAKGIFQAMTEWAQATAAGNITLYVIALIGGVILDGLVAIFIGLPMAAAYKAAGKSTADLCAVLPSTFICGFIAPAKPAP